MRKLKWILGALAVGLLPALQSCDDDDCALNYVVCPVDNYCKDWATVHTTGGGGYYLEGDQWGVLTPVVTDMPGFRPVDGERVFALFDPLANATDSTGVRVRVAGVQGILTKQVELLSGEEDEKKYGNDPIVIKKGRMWLGGKYLNIIFQQNLPARQPHLISLVERRNTLTEEITPPDEEGYIHLELRYNTYGDVTGVWKSGCVSYNLEKYYLAERLKGFKVTIHSQENGEGRVVVLDLDHPIGVPEEAKEIQAKSSFLQ